MKYTYLFLISALIPSLTHTMYDEKASTHIIIDIKEIHHKHIRSNQHKKPHSKPVRLSQHGIDGVNDTYKTNSNTQKLKLQASKQFKKV